MSSCVFPAEELLQTDELTIDKSPQNPLCNISVFYHLIIRDLSVHNNIFLCIIMYHYFKQSNVKNYNFRIKKFQRFCLFLVSI